MDSAHLDICHLEIRSKKEKFGSLILSQLMDREDTDAPERWNLRRYPISDSQEFFEMKFEENRIRIERKK
ncbi:hypothetical protein GCK72_021063 [Caenorhabditis remanei]|uniref:Uncharacterized protein n=1 Tax=Caenorhabditis remanei TaxID=31234 RepID=A0A6A5GH42_CAERE|nr:hypothetical protein GCK72_021063 [Caenorhabditis remanei]KAF1754500.1 hypothetical protein GCK72_021063 [Caenorhabditis remanei]